MDNAILPPGIIAQWLEMAQRNIHCFPHFFRHHGIERIALVYPNTQNAYVPSVDTLVKMFAAEVAAGQHVSVAFYLTESPIGLRGIPKLNPSDFTGSEPIDAMVVAEHDVYDSLKGMILQINPALKVFWLGDIITDVYQAAMIAAPLVDTLIKLKVAGHRVLFMLAPTAMDLERPSPYERLLVQYGIQNGGIGRALKELFPHSGLGDKYTFDEYVKVAMSPLSMIPKKNYHVMADHQSASYNITNSIRATVGQPKACDFRVHVFGNSAGLGAFLADEDTSSSHLQACFNKNGARACVLNYCVDAATSSNISLRIQDTAIDEQDSVVVIQPKCGTNAVHADFFGDYYIQTMRNNGIPVINANEHFQRPHDLGEVFLDARHLNHNGNKRLGRLIYAALADDAAMNAPLPAVPCPYFGMAEDVPDAIAPVGDWYDIVSDSAEFRSYVAKLKTIAADIPQATGVIGSIVVNCNPFTLGHRYLIAKAAAEVDFLYVFVVEEDKSVFPFEDRINLVDLGTEDLPNVGVMGSGKFMISTLTFPEYFTKGERQGAAIDPSADVELFALYIAPALGITIRFAGTEPNDTVTRQYNESMARLLPRYNIAFREVQRVETDDQPISASRVRKLLEERNFEAIEKLVPPTTLAYLRLFAERKG